MMSANVQWSTPLERKITPAATRYLAPTCLTPIIAGSEPV
jgi:hypothetical protein